MRTATENEEPSPVLHGRARDLNHAVWRCVVLAVALGITGNPVMRAQVVTGQITGRVTDPSAAVVPDAQVSVLNMDTGLQRRVPTNSDGYYTIPLLPPGSYDVSVQKAGFRPATRTGISVRVDQIVNTEFVLELGAVSEAVEVAASAVQVDAQSASMGTVVESRSLINLPLSQRNTYALTLLAPGVLPAREGATLAATFVGTYRFRVNGGGEASSEVMLDGITNSVTGAYPVNFAVLLPPPDAVEEFKVQSSTYMAEFGRSGGGIVNTVMKSGTNEFHGSAHEFFQNKVLNANGFFSNKNGQPILDYKRNQFGGTLGGPIKRNKMFFFGSWESLRQGSQAERTDTVPTLLQRQGDFSQSYQLVGGNCTPIQIYDPASTRPNPNGSGSIRDAFPGNVIPSTRLDKVGVNWVSYYPKPNATGINCTNASNFFGEGINTLNTYEFDAKFDWNASEKDRMFVGLGVYNYSNLNAVLWGTAADTGGSGNGPNSQPAKSIRMDYTRVVSPTFLLNFRGGAVRWERTQAPFPQDWQMANLGFPSSMQAQMSQPVSFPYTAVDSYSGMGANISYIFQASTVYQAVANATWVRGQHTLKFGGEYRIEQTFENTGLSTSGTYTFSKSFTQGPNPNTAAANLGSGIATMLLGLGTGSTPISPGVFTSSRYTALYIQDKFKVTPKLTMDIGVRYDLQIPRKERDNNLSYWDFYSPSPLAAGVPSLPNLHGGLRFVGVDASSQFTTHYKNFAPRFGLAYALTPKTAIRAGYGLSYSQCVCMAVGQSAGNAGFLSTTTWVSSLDGITPYNYLSNAYPNGLTKPTGSSLGLLTNVGQAITSSRGGVFIHNTPVGYVQLWNFNIQREWKGIVLEAAYNANKGTHLPSTSGWETNQLPTQDLALGTALQQLVPNPFYGIIQQGSLAQPTVARGQLLRPYPQFLGAQTWWPAILSSNYNAFQFQAQKDISHGIGFLFAYTFSKNIENGTGPFQDAYNRASARSISSDNNPYRVVFSVNYDLPFGNGKAWGSNWSPAMKVIAGGWHTNAIFTFSSGWPLSFTAANVAGLYNLVEMPNIIGDPNLGGGRSTADKLVKWFNTAAFQQPAAFTLGNADVYQSIYSDGIKNIDFSLFKEFSLGDRMRSEFRAESFNFFNRPEFALPGTTVGSSSFGVVSAQQNTPRVIQLALKIRF